MKKQSYVYILASKRNGTLYVGVTSDIFRRTYEHKSKTFGGFTAKYSIYLLVYYEIFTDVNYAIRREKQLKSWNRAWKIRLIERDNPEWEDIQLYR